MKLDPELLQYLNKEHFRVLTAVEMGMRNHEYVPHQLIESLSGLKRSNAFKLLQFCLKHKLVMHIGGISDGYALTNMGYDYLVLQVFIKRGHVKKVGLKIGMGKESDVYVCSTDNEERPTVIVKFARLGRTSFRTVKANRDYLKKGQGAHSWLYMSRLASLKEFAFMKALYDRGFPTPVPIDSNRHGICMSLVEAYPMTQVSVIPHPTKVYNDLIALVIKLAEHGLVHGDFNEFNLMLDDDEKITMIDFPQMVSTSHPNAKFYFERDIKCVQTYFTRNYGMLFEGIPILEDDIDKQCDMDQEVKASGFLQEQLGKDGANLDQALDGIADVFLQPLPQDADDDNEENEESGEEGSDDAAENGEETKGEEDADGNQEGDENENDEKAENEDDNDSDSNSDEDTHKIDNRKVRFAETFAQREEIKKSAEEPVENKNKEEKEVEVEVNAKPKKVRVNQEYVKNKVKGELKNQLRGAKNKRNMNKDKKNHEGKSRYKRVLLG